MDLEAFESARKLVSRTFELVEIAEEEISKAKQRHPRDAPALDAAFIALRPSDILQGLSPKIYRAHARELLERIAQRQKLGPGTDAECLAALSRASLVAPPSRQAAALMEQLFAKVFGTGRTFQLLGSSVHREPWENAGSELLHEIRRKATCTHRTAIDRQARAR